MLRFIECRISLIASCEWLVYKRLAFIDFAPARMRRDKRERQHLAERAWRCNLASVTFPRPSFILASISVRAAQQDVTSREIKLHDLAGGRIWKRFSLHMHAPTFFYWLDLNLHTIFSCTRNIRGSHIEGMYSVFKCVAWILSQQLSSDRLTKWLNTTPICSITLISFD